jgi:hypothetical protein
MTCLVDTYSHPDYDFPHPDYDLSGRYIRSFVASCISTATRNVIQRRHDAASTIQQMCRCAEKKRGAREDYLIRRLQQFVRVCRRRHDQLLLRKQAAVLVVQCAVRCYQAKCALSRLSSALVRALHRKRVRHKATITIQCRCRQRQSMALVGTHRRERKAAISIQCAVRRRRVYGSWKARRGEERASVVLQCSARVARARREHTLRRAQKNATITIQCRCRQRQSMALVGTHRRERKAAISIQCAVRRRRALAGTLRRRQEAQRRWQAAVVLQSRQRSRAAAAHRHALQIAVSRLKAWLGVRVRQQRLVKELQRRSNNRQEALRSWAVLHIQSRTRQWSGRRAVNFIRDSRQVNNKNNN